jgi:excisionase family DNA binding protein
MPRKKKLPPELPPPADPAGLITVKEAAARLGIHPQTVRVWIMDGTITGYRVGPKLIRLDPADVAAMARPEPVARGGAA